MAQYDDLYLRSSLGGPGTVPRQGPQNHSPDVIPWGMSPQPSAAAFFQENYDQDAGRPLVSNGANYIYVRAKNLGSAPASGVVSLYWSKLELLQWPTIWGANQLRTSDGADSVELSDVAPGQVGVTADPFRWIPPDTSSYALIARLATDRHPNPLPKDHVDFQAWLAASGGSGSLNVSIVSVNSPLFSFQSVYNQGPETARILIVASCKDCNVRQSYIGFTSGTPLADGSLVCLVKTPIDSDNFLAGTEVTIQAGWESTFAVNYWSNQRPKPSLTISLMAMYDRPGDPRSGKHLSTIGTITAKEIQAMRDVK